MLIDRVCGPIYYRVLITGAAADRDYAARLVSAVFEGAFGPAAEAAPQHRHETVLTVTVKPCSPSP